MCVYMHVTNHEQQDSRPACRGQIYFSRYRCKIQCHFSKLGTGSTVTTLHVVYFVSQPLPCKENILQAIKMCSDLYFQCITMFREMGLNFYSERYSIKISNLTRLLSGSFSSTNLYFFFLYLYLQEV